MTYKPFYWKLLISKPLFFSTVWPSYSEEATSTKWGFIANKVRCSSAFFCFSSLIPGAAEMHNPRAAAASLPCSLQIKSLAKGLCTQIWDGFTQPRENQGSFWRKSQGWSTWARAAALPGLSSPQKLPFLSWILYKQSCSSLRGSNAIAIAAGDELKEEISSQPLM